MYKAGLKHKALEEVFSEDYEFLKNEYNQEIRHDKNKILYYNKMAHLYFRDEDIIELLKDEIRNEMWSYVVFKIPDKNKDINELNEVYFIIVINRCPDLSPEILAWIRFCNSPAGLPYGMRGIAYGHCMQMIRTLCALRHCMAHAAIIMQCH